MIEREREREAYPISFATLENPETMPFPTLPTDCQEGHHQLLNLSFQSHESKKKSLSSKLK